MNSARPESGPRPRYAGPTQRGKLVGRPMPAAPCGSGHRVGLRARWRSGTLTGSASEIVVTCGSPDEQEGGSGVAPGKEEDRASHQGGRASTRQRRRWWHRRFIIGELR
jgi:hypothetical protein